MRPSALGWGVGAVLAAVLLAALGWGLAHPAERAPASVVGRPAPDLTIRAMDGSSVRLADLRGRPVVLNFWASWCAPCRQEAPVLAQAARSLGSRVAFLGVDFADSAQAARSYLTQTRYPYPVGTAVGGIPAEYGISSPPVTYFIDGRGVVVAHFSGPLDMSSIDRYLQLVGVT